MPTLTKPITTSDHKRGNIHASIILLEYGDFECPYCGEAYSVIKKLLQKRGDAFFFVFRDFPLSQIHPHALHAAYAAEAAGNQKKFWEMHDMLFEHQDDLEDAALFSYADILHLNRQQFRQDFSSTKIAQKVQSDFTSGIESGVNGTPTFFLNGVRFDEGYNYQILESAIDEEIKAQNP